MNRCHVFALAVASVCVGAATANAAVEALGTYDFSSGTPTHVALTFGTFEKASQIGSVPMSGVFATSKWIGTSYNGGKYVYFEVTPVSGYRLYSDHITFSTRRTSDGPSNGQVRTSDPSMTGVTFTTGTTTTPQNVPMQFDTTALTRFRIHAYTASKQAGEFYVDDVVLHGEIQALASLQTSIVSTPASRVIKGASDVRYGLNVSNDVLTAGTNRTAETLNYSLAHSGNSGATLNGGTSFSGLAGSSTSTHYIDVDTSTAGPKTGGTVTTSSDNAFRANGAAGSPSTSHDLGSVDVLDHSNGAIAVASDSADVDANEITYAFNVSEDDAASQQFRISNLIADAVLGAEFTAGLRYVGMSKEGDAGNKFSTDASSFDLLAADTDYLFNVSLDTSTAGTYLATYIFEVADEALAAASSNTQQLKLNVIGNVTLVPEPSSLALIGMLSLPLLCRRRR